MLYVGLISKMVSILKVLSRSIARFYRVQNPCNAMYFSIIVVDIIHIDMNIIINNISIILAWKTQLCK